MMDDDETGYSTIKNGKICLFVCLFVCLSVCLFVCLFVCSRLTSRSRKFRSYGDVTKRLEI